MRSAGVQVLVMYVLISRAATMGRIYIEPIHSERILKPGSKKLTSCAKEK
jgi:hypothetical protein